LREREREKERDINLFKKKELKKKLGKQENVLII
jgi:hypothetical protein